MFGTTDSGPVATVQTRTMSDSTASDPPLMQRVYDRIWILAAAALLFWFLAYIGWGLLDLVSVPAGGI